MSTIWQELTSDRSGTVHYSYDAKAEEAEDDQNGDKYCVDKDIKDEDPPDGFLVMVKEEETEVYC